MPIVVNSNSTATTASFNLSQANDSLRKSLARLSSGKRIVSPADDAGGMAVAYKLNSKLTRTEAARQNIQNGISYLQVQDGALTTMANIIDRMAELRTMANDVTKNTQDVENYSKEFIELQRQLNQVRHEKFNGISLFATSQTLSTNTPPDLRPQLSKTTGVDDMGRSYEIFSRQILTTADGVVNDGNVSKILYQNNSLDSDASNEHRHTSFLSQKFVLVAQFEVDLSSRKSSLKQEEQRFAEILGERNMLEKKLKDLEAIYSKNLQKLKQENSKVMFLFRQIVFLSGEPIIVGHQLSRS